jgi:hypothetical protein
MLFRCDIHKDAKKLDAIRGWYCPTCRQLAEGVTLNDPTPTQGDKPDPIQARAGEAMRFNDDKPPLGYLLSFPRAIREFAKVCAYGARKYDHYNYLTGAPLSQYVNCMLRHLTSWHEGEDYDTGNPDDPTDKGSGCHHLAHVIWNALCLLEMAFTQPKRDDRPHVVLAKNPTH